MMGAAEIVVAILAVIGLLCVVATICVVAWALLAGDREPLYDAPPTLDVQNHEGDPPFADDDGPRTLLGIGTERQWWTESRVERAIRRRVELMGVGYFG